MSPVPFAALALLLAANAATAAPAPKAGRAALAEACELAARKDLAPAALARANDLAQTLPAGALSDRAALLCAEILWSQGRYADAVSHFRLLARSSDPATARNALVREAECRAAEGDLDVAIERVHKLDDPGRGGHAAGDAALLRTALYMARGRLDEARSVLALFSDRHPARRDAAEVRRLRGLLAVASGAPDEGLSLLSGMEDPHAKLFRALALDASGRALPAAGLLGSVAASGGDLAPIGALLTARALERSGDLAGAEAALRRYLERYTQDPSRACARIWLASTLLRRGEWTAALAESSPLEGSGGGAELRPVARLISAEALRRSGRPADAVSAFRRALGDGLPAELLPFALDGLARAAFASGEPALAVQALARSTGGSDENAGRAWLLRGLARHRARDTAGAVTVWLSLLDRPVPIALREKALLAACAAMTESKELARMTSLVPFRLAGLEQPGGETVAAAGPARLTYERARILLHLAFAYLGVGMTAEAAAAFEKVAAAPSDAQAAALACEGRGLAALKESRAADARARFLELRDRHVRVAGRPDPSLLLADAAFNERRYADAASHYESALRGGRLDPAGAAAARDRQALAYREQGYLTQAVDIWTSLARENPDPERAASFLTRAAQTHFLAHRFKKAAEVYEQILASKPRQAVRRQALLGAGRAKLSAGDEEGALASFSQVVEMGADEAAVKEALTGMETAGYRVLRARKGGDVSAAAAALRAFADRFPDSPLSADVRLRLATLLLDAGKHAESETVFREIVDRHPGTQASAHALLGLGMSHEKADRAEAAAQAYAQLISSFPDSALVPDASLALAGIRFAAGRHEEALSLYRSLPANAAGERRAAAAYNAALCLAALRRDAEAQAAFRDAAALLAKSGGAGARVAEAKLRAAAMDAAAGRHQEAAGALAGITGALSGPARAEAFDLLGESHLALGRSDQAVSAWRRLETISPASDPHRVRGLARLAELYESRNQRTQAKRLYRAIATSGAGPEWIEVASTRLSALGD